MVKPGKGALRQVPNSVVGEEQDAKPPQGAERPLGELLDAVGGEVPVGEEGLYHAHWLPNQSF